MGLEQEHGQQVTLLEDSGVDFLLLETLNTVRETMVLLRAAAQTGLPCYVNLVTDTQGDLLSGEPLRDALDEISQYHPTAVLLNCRPPQIIQEAADRLAALYLGRKRIFANGHG